MRDNKVMDKFLKVVAEAGFQQDEPLDMSNSKHRNKLFVWILKRQQFGNAKLFEHLNEISPRGKFNCLPCDLERNFKDILIVYIF